MILPIRTNVLPRRTPYVNYGLIGINALIFLITYAPHVVRIGGQQVQEPLRAWADIFMLEPARPYLWQFVTYAFLHGSIMHIVGNMYFLYIFGNNVNDRLGNIGYLAFYLAGAIFSGLGHAMLPGASSVLGASGAVAAVTGAYLVLYPQTLITTLVWLFYFLRFWEIPALWFIAIKMIFIDNILVRTSAHVAYDAHLAGYAFGILANLLLLATGLLEKDQFDLWSMIRQWNRRRRYRATVAGGYDPFKGVNPRKKVWVKVKDSEPDTQDPRAQARAEIMRLVMDKNLPLAAEKYQQLLREDPEQILSQQSQLDVANQLMSDGQWQSAAKAYENFLSRYSSHSYANQVHLMLGVLYARYLDQPERAIEYLNKAKKELTDPNQMKMCREQLDRLQS